MARCHIVIGLCVMHLCLAFSWGGFEYNPALVPQAQGYYPQPNPYANYGPYGPNMYQQGPYSGQYPQPQYGDEDSFLQIDNQNQQEPTTETTDSGAAEPSTSGGAVPSISADTASVQTPQETAEDSTGTSSTPATNSNMDPLDIQLAAALEAVKADMISKGKQVLEEKQWTDDVKGVIEQYTKKISNVYGNIEKLKKDMTDLYKKKQQIINAQIQKRLTQQLKDSKSDLQTVQAALDKVTNTQMEFEQSKKDIQATIDSIFTQLSELKGQPAPAAGAAEGEAGAAKEGDKKEGDAKEGEEEEGAKGETTEAASEAGAGASSDSSEEDSDTDIVDRTAEINSKIDTIKSIVSALNKGSPSAVQ